MKRILEKFFGSKHDRDLKKIRPLLDKINALDDSYKILSDDELKSKTSEFRSRLAEGEALDAIQNGQGKVGCPQGQGNEREDGETGPKS